MKVRADRLLEALHASLEPVKDPFNSKPEVEDDDEQEDEEDNNELEELWNIELDEGLVRVIILDNIFIFLRNVLLLFPAKCSLKNTAASR